MGFDYDPTILSELKKIGGFLYNPENKEWYKEISLESGKQTEYFFKKHDFTFGRPERKQRPVPELHQKELISLTDLKSLIKSLSLKREPRQYQLEGIHYMINHPNSINGCAPGLGKTSMSLVLTEVLDLFPCLIITPSAVKYGWRDEWYKWVDSDKRKIQVLKSTSKWEPLQDVYILNYDILWKKEDGKAVIRFPELIEYPWQVIICDEAHLCKNEKSIRSKMLYSIAKKVDLIYPLSGTIVLNRPAELISILKLTNWFDKLFSNWMSYVYRYCNAKRRVVRGQDYGWDISCASNTLELNNIISKYCYYRKEKRDVLTELPPLIEQIIPIECSNKKEYKKAGKDLIDYLANIDEERAEKAERAEHLVKLNVLKELSLKGKMKGIEVFLNEWKEITDDKLLIFGVRREPLIELARKYNGLLIQGGIDAKKKHDLVKQFQGNEYQFLFANIDAVGTGVDGLQECCSNLVYIELPDKFTTLEQTNSRLERMGQENSINVFYLLCPETIDSYVSEMIENKKKITNAINKGLDVDVSELDIDFNILTKLKRDNS